MSVLKNLVWCMLWFWSCLYQGSDCVCIGVLIMSVLGLWLSLLQVCGNARVWGDGIIPIKAAHLEGELPPF